MRAALLTGGAVLILLITTAISQQAGPVLTVSNTNVQITINASTSLGSDLVCGSLMIDNGVTLTTDGYSILCNGTVTNDGVINTGVSGSGGGETLSRNATNGGSYPYSLGGSGGGGGAVNCQPSWYAGNGGNTLAAGGLGGTQYGYAHCSSGQLGATPQNPVVDNANILAWYSNGLVNYDSGAGGGGGGGGAGFAGGPGGDGAYGIYIQADNVTAGNIIAAGDHGVVYDGCYFGSSGGGGGGGGTIIIAYGRSYTNGTYNISGGSFACGAWGGGSGGDGRVITYNYANAPIFVQLHVPIANITNTTNSTNVTITPPPGGSGGGGGGGGGSGGGGAFLPLVAQQGSCTVISNLSELNQETFTLFNSTFNITDNFISPNDTGVSIRGKNYTLFQGSATNLFYSEGVRYYAELTSLSYIPIIHLVTIRICGDELVTSTSTTTTTTTMTSTTTIPTTSTTTIPANTEMAKPPPVAASIPLLPVALGLAVILVIASAYAITRGRREDED